MYESLADNTHMNNVPKCGIMQIMVLLRMMITAKKIGGSEATPTGVPVLEFTLLPSLLQQ